MKYFKYPLLFALFAIILPSCSALKDLASIRKPELSVTKALPILSPVSSLPNVIVVSVSALTA